MMTEATTTETRPRLLTFGAGGWVILLAVAFTILVMVLMGLRIVQHLSSVPPGDGRDPATYGFALTPSLIDTAAIAAAQKHRDVVPSLQDPSVMPGGSVATFKRGTFLVPSDRVVGVVIDGVARAYPLSMLACHAVVNDRLGERDIAVTYDPICDSAVVFDRTPDGVETPLEFGVSGLVCNANLLFYDRSAEPGAESLWSQLRGRAVTGPAAAAGLRLERIPFGLVHWSDWLDAHPDTTVLEPNLADDYLMDMYKKTSYDGYYQSDTLFFGASAPPVDEPAVKAPCVVIMSSAGGRAHVVPYPVIEAAADADGVWETELDGRLLRFSYRHGPPAVRVTAEDGGSVDAIHVRWFAWYGIDPDAAVVTGTGVREAG